MVPLRYWFLRLVRRATPRRAAEWMLERGFVLHPGLETSDPRRAVARYQEVLRRGGKSFAASTVVVVGYGGGLGVALHLLEAGAERVILQDPFAPRRRGRDTRLDAGLLGRYCRREDDSWIPDPQRVELFHEPLSRLAERSPECADFILSSSVLEHVEDLPEIVRACARLTRPGGLNVHFVDLRDHVFSYPFEMLCYSEKTWRRWLDSGLNRLRWRDYEAAWKERFPDAGIEAIEALPAEFRRVKPRIRREFLTGDDRVDSVGQILITAPGLDPAAPASSAVVSGIEGSA